MTGNVPRSSGAYFDVSDEQHVAALLKLVRRSTLDPQSKDDIRDVVFDLRKSFDETLLAELQLYVEPLGISVGSGSDGAAAQVPEVQTHSAPPADVLEPEPSVAVVAPRPAVAFSGFGRVRPVPMRTSGPAASAAPSSQGSNQPVTFTPASVPPQAENSVPPAPEAPEVAPPAPTSTPVVEAPVAAAGTPPPPTLDLAAAQQRIDSIKRTVNAAVGNPVNLIDANNTVGREYMNALLAAMKSVAGGGAGLAEAMARLETAFAAVEGVLATGTPSAAQEAAPAPAPVAETTPEPPTERSGYEAVVEAPIEAEPADAPAPKPQDFDPALPVTPSGGVRSVAAMGSAWQHQAAVTAPAPVAKEAASDPLVNPTIDAGLAQLLSEWKLFKSSGFFGTGPSGIDHPLYQSIKNLKMNQVITGRFDGATPEVKQSITDYMNGWRYEQGMTHDMQETFEHYLRRVIKAIIDKRTIARP